LVFFFTLRVFQAYKQQQSDPAYLHQINLNSKEFRFFLTLRAFQANKQQRLGPTYLHQDQP
jgi:hypothetical protein